MGPRPFSRGNRRLADGPQNLCCSASMGPRPFSRGNRPDQRPARGGDQLASMGPRPFSRGNWKACASRADDSPQLQWGRGLSAAETAVSGNSSLITTTLQWGRGLSAAETSNNRVQDRLCVHRASMGPRPFSRGNHDRIVGGTRQNLASMGPRPFSRGNKSATIRLTLPKRLQWNRGLSAAETTQFGGLLDGESDLLQWGRGLSAAETLLPQSRPQLCLSRLQWGRGLSAAETIPPDRG